MTKREIAFFACKVLAIIALLDFIGTLQSLVSNIQHVYNSQPALLVNGAYTRPAPSPLTIVLTILESLVPTALFMLTAIGLWFGAPRLARRMTRRQPFVSNVVHLDEHQSISIAFAVLGVYILSSAVPRSLSFLVQFLVQYLQPSFGTFPIDAWLGRLAQMGAELVIGIGLHFRSRQFARYLYRKLRQGK